MHPIIIAKMQNNPKTLVPIPNNLASIKMITNEEIKFKMTVTFAKTSLIKKNISIKSF